MMWGLAFGLYAAGKLFTWIELRVAGPVCPKRTLVYLFLWPGMDAPAFFGKPEGFAWPDLRESAAAITRLLLGAGLLWGVARCVPGGHPLLTGWVGMLGMILILHFGVFHLASILWRATGLKAAPLMWRPASATSLADFWGARWNRGFHDLAHRYLFLPLKPKVGTPAAMLATFTVSGLIHEAVISVPAGGGYGWPLGYFILQGLGLLVQRSRWSRRGGWNHGVRGWLFTMAFAAGPAFWLFHPLFVVRVIDPFMHAIHAL